MERNTLLRQTAKIGFIHNESRKKPLSYQAITDLLGQEGVLIARRTVAKYRESIKIASSRDRKKEYLVESLAK